MYKKRNEDQLRELHNTIQKILKSIKWTKDERGHYEATLFYKKNGSPAEIVRKGLFYLPVIRQIEEVLINLSKSGIKLS